VESVAGDLKVQAPEATITVDVFNLSKSKFNNASLTDMYHYVEECLKNKNGYFLSRGVDRKKENIIVEYGSPNIAKPFHMGHFRSMVTGHFVSRICQHAGNNVTSICFLGDWGTQFGILQVSNILLQCTIFLF